jgi:ArsR family transcriptional regulator, arsenate/arsenite/antimonite-responsive transcriptional repressor
VPASSVEPVRRAPAPTPEAVAEIEAVTQHDVIAFLSAWADNTTPRDAAAYVHFGMTSSDLLDTGPAGLTPGVMQEGLGIPATTLSFHLKELANAGLVSAERSSRNLVYRAAFVEMNGLLAYLTENCCQGAACGVETAVAACKG